MRPINEDGVLLLYGNGAEGARLSVAAVADGMGGHAAGEMASSLALQAVRKAWTQGSHASPQSFLIDSIQAANSAIWMASNLDPAWQGMGTTLTVAYLGVDHIWIGHVGDSRAYRIGTSDIEQLTEDDHLGLFMVKAGLWEPQVAEAHADRDALWQAVGTRPKVEQVHLYGPVQVSKRDVIVLCTDGLYEVLSPGKMVDVVRTSPSVHSIADTLIREALQARSTDNFSSVVLRQDRLGPQGSSTKATAERKCV